MPGLVLYASPQQSWASALAMGAEALGWSVLFQRGSVWTPDQSVPGADAVVSFGARHRHGELLRWYGERGIPTVVQDLSRWRALEGHTGLYVGGLHGLPPCGVPGRREALAPDAVRSPRAGGDFVLVIGQKRGDASHGLDDRALTEWTDRAAREAAARTGLPIRYRPHPKGQPIAIKAPHDLIPTTEPLDFAGAAEVVTYCSTVGLEALMAGIPVTCSDAAYYAPWARDPSRPRTELLDRVLATQWTLDELADGTAWRFATEWIAGTLPETTAAPPEPKVRTKRRRKAVAA